MINYRNHAIHSILRPSNAASLAGKLALAASIISTLAHLYPLPPLPLHFLHTTNPPDQSSQNNPQTFPTIEKRPIGNQPASQQISYQRTSQI